VRFQRFAGVPATGRAGPLTRRTLRAPPPACPVSLARPVQAEIGDRHGPRGARMHAGIDLLAGAVTPVTAARAGRVVVAGAVDRWGLFVVIDHGDGLQTGYAHLARILVRTGTAVAAGALIGRVGATGNATGPHLHFEVRVRGAYTTSIPRPRCGSHGGPRASKRCGCRPRLR
jgi:murein DD-endopeptidase MepM/ murein hydrolase activator NlpD